MNQIRNIIVTGSNKGIGFGIVNHLAKSQNWNIIMACRNIQLANKSRDEVLEKFPNAKLSVEKLDVSDLKSIAEFINTVKEKYNHIDVLVNNAGIAAKGDAFDVDIIDWTNQTNVYGTIELSEKILPVLSKNGKIVTLGSMAGKMSFAKLKSEELKQRFQKQNIQKEELIQLLKEFRQAVSDGTYEQKGWPKSAYGISKLVIDLYASYLGRQKEVIDNGIQIYVCCPGYVNTDMTSHKGHLTIEEGILTPVYLIELPFQINKDLQGKFFQKQAVSNLFC